MGDRAARCIGAQPHRCAGTAESAIYGVAQVIDFTERGPSDHSPSVDAGSNVRLWTLARVMYFHPLHLRDPPH